MSNKYALNWFDVYKAVQMYTIGMVVMTVLGTVATAGFDIFTADWVEIIKNAANVSINATAIYILKNFLTDPNGNW